MENQTKEKAVKPLFTLPETQKEFEKEVAEIKAKHTLSDSQLERIRKVTIEKHKQKEKAKIAQRRANAEIAKAMQTAKAQERRDDTRKKIIAGALLLAMQDDEKWKQPIADLLNTITKDADRALFGLSPLPKPEQAQATAEGVETQEQEAEATEPAPAEEVPQETTEPADMQEAPAASQEPQQARKFSFDHLKQH